MNTIFSYMHRDAGNYKFYRDIILKGTLKHEDLQPFLHEEEFFIPSEVGLEDLQPETLTVDDHIWHEIIEIKITDRPFDCNISSKKLKNNFIKANVIGWNERKVIERKGL